jgi:hypothetical protein
MTKPKDKDGVTKYNVLKRVCFALYIWMEYDLMDLGEIADSFRPADSSQFH